MRLYSPSPLCDEGIRPSLFAFCLVVDWNYVYRGHVDSMKMHLQVRYTNNQYKHNTNIFSKSQHHPIPRILSLKPFTRAPPIKSYNYYSSNRMCCKNRTPTPTCQSCNRRSPPNWRQCEHHPRNINADTVGAEKQVERQQQPQQSQQEQGEGLPQVCDVEPSAYHTLDTKPSTHKSASSRCVHSSPPQRCNGNGCGNHGHCMSNTPYAHTAYNSSCARQSNAPPLAPASRSRCCGQSCRGGQWGYRQRCCRGPMSMLVGYLVTKHQAEMAKRDEEEVGWRGKGEGMGKGVWA